MMADGSGEEEEEEEEEERRYLPIPPARIHAHAPSQIDAR